MLLFYGAFLLFISILGILEIYFANGKAGLAGYIVALSLNKIFGFWASLVLLISFILISFIMTLNIQLKIGKDEEDENGEMGETGESKSTEVEPIVVNQTGIKEEKIVSPQGCLSQGKKEEEEDDEFKIPRIQQQCL